MKTNRILIVDDSEENRYLLRSLLQGHGYDVEEACHGAEALALARKKPPDLIIADILMPVMDGFALCREWKCDERLKTIPFFFYTATYTDGRDRDFALSLGAERFIVKPEEPDAFMAAVLESLEQTRPSPTGAGLTTAAAQSQGLTGESPIEESVYLKQYNETLIRKLEDKMLQLEHTNDELKRDIAQREQVETQNREAEQRFRTVVNTLPDLIWLKDPEGVYLSCNHRFERFFGAKESEITGRTDYDFLSREQADFFRTHDREAMAKGEPTVNEEWVTFRNDGHRELLETIKTPMFDVQGKLIGVLGISRNITAHKQAETELHSQLDELNRWYKALLGRESRILELKREVNDLLRMAGQLPRYDEHVEDEKSRPAATVAPSTSRSMGGGNPMTDEKR